MKTNVSVVRNILISGKIIKEMPGSVASGTHCISELNNPYGTMRRKMQLSSWDDAFCR